MIKMEKEVCPKCGKRKDKFEVITWEDGTKEEICSSCYWKIAEYRTRITYLDGKIAESKRRRRGYNVRKI